jgi:replicative DNA helicase
MSDTIATAERTLPHNLEAERSVLGAILVHNDAFNTAAQVIDGRDFYRDAHRRIFDRMVALSERGEAIDFITLKEELSRGGDLEEVGGPAYVASLVDGVPRATNVEYYARIVKEKATLRNLIYAANKILTNAYEADQESDLILDEAESSIFAGCRRPVEGRLRADARAGQRKLSENRAAVRAQAPGDGRADRICRSRRDDARIAAGRSGDHRRAAVDGENEPRAQHRAACRRPGEHTVGFFSLEMSKESLFIRLLTSEAQIDSHRLMSGHIADRDYSRISHALEKLSSMRLFIDDTANISVLEMRAKSRRLQAEHGLSLIVVDYIQLMSARGRYENRTLELASISRSLKGPGEGIERADRRALQLSRAPESRSDHRPQLSDLRESGALEQDADVVILIYRDDAYNRDPNNPDAGTAELILAKQRNGPTGIVRLAFLREQTRFANLAPGA